MKSSHEQKSISFVVIQQRLLNLVTKRLNNGDFTERGLARVIGVSQPQIHNVLKGKRRLQPALADRIMQKFNIDVLDLLHDFELRAALINGGTALSLSPGEEPPVLRKGPGHSRINSLHRDEDVV